MTTIQRRALGLLLSLMWGLAACGSPAVEPAPTPTLPAAASATATVRPAVTRRTAVVQRADIGETVGASGVVKALADIDLTFAAGGTIKSVHVKPGDRVTAGQVLVSVDNRELELQLAQAEASLAASQAKYAQVQAGASPKEIEQAEAAVRAARAQYQQAAKGTVAPQDIANAEAALRAAEAELAAVQAGPATPPDIANAEAALRAAEAKLAGVRAGPNPATVDVATQRLSRARDNKAKLESQLATAKEQARLAVDQAASAVRGAQAKYAAARLAYEEAARRGGSQDAARLKAEYEAAEQVLKQAEQTLEQRHIAYQDAKKQEVIGLQTADSQIQEAQAQLDEVKAGPSREQVAQARAEVDQARANLEKVRQPPTENAIIQAQAAVDQARATLEKMRRGPASEALAAEQAKVDQARAALDDLQSGPKGSELAVALGVVKENEATRELRRYRLDQAVLVAPFAGVVAAVNVVTGQVVSASNPASVITLVDDSQLQVNLRVPEADIARLRLGQAARISFDALPEQRVPGVVSFISPKASVEQNKPIADQVAVSYLVTVVLETTAPSIKPGMTALVDIVTDRKQNALVIPTQAIRRMGRARVVEVQQQQETTTVPVQVGVASGTMTEVLSGLNEGDVVVINPSLAGNRE